MKVFIFDRLTTLNMNNTGFLYLKFGSYENLVELQTKGLIYCNTLHHFTKVEDGKVRGDKDETCIDMKFLGKGTTFTIKKMKDYPDEKPISFKVDDAQLKTFERDHIGNMYCLSTIAFNDVSGDSIPLYDINCHKFGSHVLFIMNSAEFMNRIINKLEELKLQFEIKSVEYKDLSKYTGKKDLFVKDISYAYQKEVRIFIKTTLNDIFTFEIGSIEEISKIIAFPNDKPIIISYAPPESNL